ncbi:helix-turn-helix domain-containing protein [Effusibacillus pohliae]|uniref:hypothetical protein n=1 Tax=Effusibacillus pohliae TaxID=232270 RepID=UPI0003664D51|nr:hypothetical protein [Effusibacillus pohliae]
MKIRLGLFGADDSIEIIQTVVSEHVEFDCLPIVYWKEEEVIERLKPHIHDVDMWLFSGQVPYSIAKEWGGIARPMFYVPHTGSGLYRTLLHITYEHKIKIDELSFDTFHPSELNRIFDEVEINTKPVFLKHYPGEIQADVLAKYHYDLWKAGQTKAAVTFLRSAHLALQRMGVPVFRVLPTRSAVHSILNLMLRTNEVFRFMDSQIAVQMIEIDSFGGLAAEAFSTDEIHQIEIKMTEKLLKYTKKVQGSLKAAGPGRYVIFTTRGLLRDITGNFTVAPELDDIYKINQEIVTCGIGIGQTAYEAEINAGKALLHAKQAGKGSWMVVFDDKMIAGPLGKQEQISYSYVSEKLQSISRQTSLSVATLSKLASIMKKMGKQEINAYELAQYMQILPRSARRILMELEAKGLAQVVGEENPHPRGRPRKLYRISLGQDT